MLGDSGVYANGDPSTQQRIGFAPLRLPHEIIARHLAHRPLSVHVYIVVANVCLPILAPAKYGLLKLPIVQQVDICEPCSLKGHTEDSEPIQTGQKSTYATIAERIWGQLWAWQDPACPSSLF